VEIELSCGSITALVGASGSGKSSLLRLLTGLMKPDSGYIHSDGVCWFASTRNRNLAVQQRKVGMVFQDYALFEHLSVYDNIAYGVVPKANRQQVVADWLERINLRHKADVYPQDLSGGEKQRVALARVLATKPDVLLLDEPFSALDTHLRHDLRRALQSIICDTQIPVLIATHDLDEARFLADSIYVLSGGKIIQHGPVPEVFQTPKTIQAAKVLGWQNILLVDSFEAGRISGQWGQLVCPDVSQNDNQQISAVVIPVRAISVVTSSHATDSPDQLLSLVVMHSADMGGHYLVEGRLGEKNIVILSFYSDKKPDIGQILLISIDYTQIIPLIHLA